MIQFILKKTTVTLSLFTAVLAILGFAYAQVTFFGAGIDSRDFASWLQDAATAGLAAALAGLVIDALREVFAHAKNRKVPFKFKLHKVLAQNLAT